MTRELRPLQITPRLELRTTASRRTARASHAAALASLADDSALGHHGQRSTVTRTLGGVFHSFYQPGLARWLRVTVAVAFRGLSWSGDGVTVALEIHDGTNTVLSSDTRLPEALRATTLYPTGTSPGRMSSVQSHTVLVDLATLLSTLDVTAVWRLKWTVVVGATSACEGITCEEMPRLVVDDTAAAGVLTTLAMPRAPILGGDRSFARITESIAWAYSNVLHTYHAASPGEADPFITTSPTYAPMGEDSDDGDERVHTVRPRIVRGSSINARARWRVRYRITGAASGDLGFVRLVTGAGTYVLTLSDVSGSWVDSPVETAYLATSSAKDTLRFRAKVDAGTLEVSARTVWDYPAA